MARSLGLHLSDGTQAPGRARWGVLRDLVGGALLLALWLTIWSFLALGVAGPLGSLQQATRPAAQQRA